MEIISSQAYPTNVSRVYSHTANKFSSVKEDQTDFLEDIKTPQPQKHILLVEDVPMLQKVHMHFLASMGYKVTLATNGLDALKRFNAAKFDLIILDIGLPDISGLEVSKRVREQDNPIPILALTAFSPSLINEDCLSAGINQVATKPIMVNELQRLIIGLLRSG